MFIVENNLSEKDYWYIFPKKNVPLVSGKEIDSISVREINSLNVVENNKRSDSAIFSSTLLPSLIDTYSPNELEDFAV